MIVNVFFVNNNAIQPTVCYIIIVNKLQYCAKVTQALPCDRMSNGSREIEHAKMR